MKQRKKSKGKKGGGRRLSVFQIMMMIFSFANHIYQKFTFICLNIALKRMVTIENVYTIENQKPKIMSTISIKSTVQMQQYKGIIMLKEDFNSFLFFWLYIVCDMHPELIRGFQCIFSCANVPCLIHILIIIFGAWCSQSAARFQLMNIFA